MYNDNNTTVDKATRRLACTRQREKKCVLVHEDEHGEHQSINQSVNHSERTVPPPTQSCTSMPATEIAYAARNPHFLLCHARSDFDTPTTYEPLNLARVPTASVRHCAMKQTISILMRKRGQRGNARTERDGKTGNRRGRDGKYTGQKT